MVMDRSGEFIVRAFGSDLKPHPVDMIRIIGDRWHIRYSGRDSGVTSAEFDRQVRLRRDGDSRPDAAARGNRGCGRHGLPIAMPARTDGRPYFALIDKDYVDITNVNRLHYSTRTHAIARTAKVDVLGDAIAGDRSGAVRGAPEASRR